MGNKVSQQTYFKIIETHASETSHEVMVENIVKPLIIGWNNVY